MPISDLCQVYLTTTASGKWDNWKKTLFDIADQLEAAKHPDYHMFYDASCTLMMNDKPGYLNWLNNTIAKLMTDSMSTFDPLPVLPDYDELSSQDLVDKYEDNDENYSKHEILVELKERFPSLIELDAGTLNVNLRETLKDVFN